MFITANKLEEWWDNNTFLKDIEMGDTRAGILKALRLGDFQRVKEMLESSGDEEIYEELLKYVDYFYENS